jgi:hypothetical protein
MHDSEVVGTQSDATMCRWTAAADSDQQGVSTGRHLRVFVFAWSMASFQRNAPFKEQLDLLVTDYSKE